MSDEQVKVREIDPAGTDLYQQGERNVLQNIICQCLYPTISNLFGFCFFQIFLKLYVQIFFLQYYCMTLYAIPLPASE